MSTLPGHLATNVMHFARVLRTAGLPLGSDRVQLALSALPHAGLESRNDFHAVLSACLLDRAEHRELFDQAFAVFWRDPDLTGRLMAMLMPKVQAKTDKAAPPPRDNRRLADAFFPHRPPPPGPPPEAAPALDIDMALTFSERERLHKADFDSMSTAEWQQALKLLKQLAPLFEPLRTLRQQRARRPGTLDGRATLQALARQGGDAWQLRWRAPRHKPAPLVLLADISGSMSRYSRMLLHFGHALGHAEAKVESFVFGTRLTRTTRALAARDPDIAIGQVVRAVQDWSGGTRISQCLAEFNQRWARRVLPSNATVLLVSDGLEFGSPDDPGCEQLAFQMERLHKSCRRLVWLNPLLRFAAFEPRAAGIRAMRQHVDHFLPAHNLDSLADLARVLGKGPKQPAPVRPRNS